MSEQEHQLLVTLATRDPSDSKAEMAGRDLLREYVKRTGHAMNYGEFYVTMRKLTEQGYVAARDGQDAYGRVRYYTFVKAKLDA